MEVETTQEEKRNFSWPRGERPQVHSSSLTEEAITPTQQGIRSLRPSVSIEPNESLELTEELLDNQKVESNDSLPSKAVGSDVVVTKVIYCSEDEESVDGEVVIGEELPVYVEEEEEGEGKKITLPPTDSVSSTVYCKLKIDCFIGNT